VSWTVVDACSISKAFAHEIGHIATILGGPANQHMPAVDVHTHPCLRSCSRKGMQSLHLTSHVVQSLQLLELMWVCVQLQLWVMACCPGSC
jgi:hypothetical protein